MDSESKNNYIGSFLQPPSKIFPAAFASAESKKLAAVGGDRPSVPNNQAVVAALKTLQEKIHRLEVEKSQAEDNLCSLSIAAAQYKKALESESYKKETAHQELMQQREGVRVELNAAQSRCSLLEKQLDYMRTMVSSAEQERKKVLEQQAKLQKEEDQNWLQLHAKLEKLEMLEKECLKLTATQRITEEKIKCLEEKLCKEEHHHKLMQDKTAQLQTGFERNRILVSSATSQNEPKKGNRKKKKNKKKNPTVKTKHLSQLHIKAGELPFVAGKYIPDECMLCEGVNHAGQKASNPKSIEKNARDYVINTYYAILVFNSEHQELLKHLQETQGSKGREDLGWELNCLVKQMEVKGEQISKLDKHQATKLKRKTQELKQGAAHVQPKCGDLKEAKEIVKRSVSKSCPGQKSRSSLQLLKTVQKLQSRLRKCD
ncbi:CE57L protein, partial [Indicator maculatus]|nr:CE57L protein [Indicator maculatus]